MLETLLEFFLSDSERNYWYGSKARPVHGFVGKDREMGPPQVVGCPANCPERLWLLAIPQLSGGGLKGEPAGVKAPVTPPGRGQLHGENSKGKVWRSEII